MEPTIAIISILLFAVALLYKVKYKAKTKEANKKRLTAAKLRADKRKLENIHDDEPILSDAYTMSMEFTKVLKAVELVDPHDGRGELTQTQRDTIKKIFEGHGPAPVNDIVLTSAAVSGLPIIADVLVDKSTVERKTSTK